MADIPVEIVKDAQEMQTALVQIKHLTDEVKEKKRAMRGTTEYADLKNAKERLKQFEDANKELQDLKNEIKKLQGDLKNTTEAMHAAEASRALREYKEAVNDVGRTIAERILKA